MVAFDFKALDLKALAEQALREAMKKNPVVDLRGIPMYQVFTAAAGGEEWALKRMVGEEIMTVWPGDPVRYHSFQQGVIPSTGGSLELATTVEGGLALRFQTNNGPVCYLTTIEQLQEALDKSKEFPAPPAVEPEPDDPEEEATDEG